MSDNQNFDQRQRWDDTEEAVRTAVESAQSQMFTAGPAIVKKHNDNGTLTVQPALKQKRINQDGSTEWVSWPEVTEIPIQYPGGGGASWTFPVKEGDEVLMVVSSKNMDKWWQQGGVQEQGAPFRMHHPSDGFAIPGFRSQPRKLSNVSMSKAQLRTDDGNMVLEFDPDGKQITLKSPNNPVKIEGDLHVSGDVVWNTAGTPTHALTHEHSGVVPGGGDTGPPVAGS